MDCPGDKKTDHKYRVIGILSSSGGPKPLSGIIRKLNVPASVVILQHIPENFFDVFAEGVSRGAKMPVEVPSPEREVYLMKGRIYLIPPTHNAVLKRVNVLKLVEPNTHFVPSGDALFCSMAEVAPKRSVAVLLSGIGNDGVEGAYLLSLKGGLVVVQDPRTMNFEGIPGAALKRGVIARILHPDEIADFLNSLF